MNRQVSKKLDSIELDPNSQILQEIDAAITEKVIPQLQHLWC